MTVDDGFDYFEDEFAQNYENTTMISGVTFRQYSEAKQRNSNIILSVKFATVNCQSIVARPCSSMQADGDTLVRTFLDLQNNPVTNNADETLLSLRKRNKSP